MSKMSMVMSYKYSNYREIFFDHLRIRFNVVLMCKSGMKYQYVSRAECAYAHIIFFRNDKGVGLLEHVRLLERLW